MVVEIDSVNVVTCAICRDDIDMTVMHALHCNHKFHMDCIHSWLVIHPSCPLCRVSVPYNITRDEIENVSFETQDDFIINVSDDSDDDTYVVTSSEHTTDSDTTFLEELEEFIDENDPHDYIGITNENFNMFNWMQLSRNYRLSELSIQIFINNIERYTNVGITAILNNFSQFQILSEQFIRANITYLDARLLVSNQFHLSDEFICYLETLYQQ